MRFVSIWEQTATCATYSINWLLFITEMKSVYSAVRTGSVNKAVCASSLKGQNVGLFWGETSPLCVTNIIKMKRNRSLNTTNGLLAKMESTYVTTCFGLHLCPSSGYNLVALRDGCCVSCGYLLMEKIATRYATTVLHHFPSTRANQGYTLYTVLHTIYTRFLRLDCSFSDHWDLIINLILCILYKNS